MRGLWNIACKAKKEIASGHELTGCWEMIGYIPPRTDYNECNTRQYKVCATLFAREVPRSFCLTQSRLDWVPEKEMDIMRERQVHKG